METEVVKGLFILDKDIYDTEAMYESHKKTIDNIIDWGNKLDLCICFGGMNDHSYGCQYEMRGLTKSYLKGLVAELKVMLKPEFPNFKESFQMFGEMI